MTLYIHWPFCLSKCLYCNFFSVPCENLAIDYAYWKERYINVLINFRREYYDLEEVTSIYFGGGTPSLMPTKFFDDILNTIRKFFKIATAPEITVEVNPSSVDAFKIKTLRSIDINRLSIGIQALHDNDLKTLGRRHSYLEAIEYLEMAGMYFDNVSIDLIYNRPGQILKNWENELVYALKLPIKHISLYELIIEPNTPLKKLIDSKQLPQQNQGSKFIEKTIEIAEAAEFKMYEISNFAKPGYEGRHNLSYWKYNNYCGIGPSSHSRIMKNNQKIAIEQIANNKKWLLWAKNPIFNEVVLSEDDVFKEKLIMGLRSKVGIFLDEFSETIKNKYSLLKKISNLLKNSYIMIDDNNIKLTKDGLLRLNLIIEYLVRE